MLEVIFLFALAIIFIAFASIQDIKSREVANWISFSMIIFALGFRFFYSLFSDKGFGFFYQGLIGLAIFYILGNLLYFGRVFAGGDAKLMIALGPVLPLNYSFLSNLNLFLVFFIIFFVCGALYGIFYSMMLVFNHWNSFKKEFSSIMSKYKKVFYFISILAIAVLLMSFFSSIFAILALLIFLFPWLYLYAVSIEKTCLIFKIPTKKLTEGDWLYGEVKMGKKIIKPDWDGLNIKQIKLLQKGKKYVMIRQGIPFVPVFLISFIIFVINYLFIGIEFW